MSKSIEHRIKDLETRMDSAESMAAALILYEYERQRAEDPASAQLIRIVSGCGEVLAEREPHECEEEFLGRYYREQRLQPQTVRVFIPHNHRDDAR